MKTWKTADAQRALVLVRQITLDTMEAHGVAALAKAEHDRCANGRTAAAWRDLRRSALALLNDCVKELIDLGLQVRDVEHGLVAFPLGDPTGSPTGRCLLWRPADGNTIRRWQFLDEPAHVERPIEELDAAHQLQAPSTR